MKKFIITFAAFAAVTTANAQWKPLPTTGYWQELLHLGADYKKGHVHPRLAVHHRGVQ